MIKRDTLKQQDPVTLWQVSTPAGGRKGRPLAAYGTNGNSLEWDSWQYENGVLSVNFGIDPVSGELEFEYQNDQPEPVTITGDGGTVNITVNQNNAGAPVSQP